MQPFSFSSIQRVLSICSLFILIVGSSFAQIKLPEVPKAKDDRTEIEGTYIPHGNFLKNNPNFLNDGTYFSSSTINSETFPAGAEESSKTLSGLGKIIVQFTQDTSGGLIHVIPISGLYVFSKTFIDTKGFSDWDSKYIIKAYEELNEIYKQSSKEILLKKSVDSFSLCDVTTTEFDKTSFPNSNIIFQFVYVGSNISWKNKGSDDFPSNLFCRLIVKTVSGEILKNYSQALFYEGSAHGAFKVGKNLALTVTLPIAMENLINRFLNDETTVKIIKEKIGDGIAAKSINSYQDSLYACNQQYSYIRSKKQQLLSDLSLVKLKFIAIANSISKNQSNVANRDRTLDNNVLTSLLSNSLMGNNGEIKRLLKGDQAALDILKQTAFSLNQEEKKFIQKASATFNPFDITSVVALKENDDAQINSLLKELSDRKSETSVAFQKMSDFVNNERLTGFSNGINSFNNTTTNTGTVSSTTTQSAETMATTNGGNMDVCMQRANSEWYSSEEYKRYKRTGLNSDASDCKAKIMELTIKYCSDKLPPGELAQIKQQALKERQLADQIRAANQFRYKQ